MIQSGDRTQNNAIHRNRFTAGLGALFFSSLIALSPPSARAQCKQWDVSGRWDIKQSNGYTVHLNLTQHGTRINGSGKTLTAGLHGLHGNIQGNDFFVQITWGPDAIGIYRGKVGPEGRIDGTTYDEKSPGSKANWFSTTAMKCSEETQAASVKPESTVPPVRPKPIKSSGKAKPSATPPNPH